MSFSQTFQNANIDPGMAGWAADTFGHIGSIFGQLVFLTFWGGLFLTVLGVIFLIWLNIKHARECDVQDSTTTHTEDLLRELAPPAQRFSIIGGKAVRFDGEIPELQPKELESEDGVAEELPPAGQIAEAVQIKPEAPVVAADAADSVAAEPVDERVKYAPRFDVSPKSP